MNENTLQELADMLYIAERDAVPIAPLTEKYDTLTEEDAYLIQLKNIERLVAMGYELSGKKIGLTSRGIQRQLRVSEPDYGHLLTAMECKDGILETSQLIQPMIEAEIAFILGEDLTGGNVTIEDVRNATDYVVSALEIIDSRVDDWKITLIDTVADNASSGRYILGQKPLKIKGADLPTESMWLYKNGNLVEKGVGSNVHGKPCAAVAWLANRLWKYGIPLKKGETILSGAFSPALRAKKGDVFSVYFKSFGTIEAEFR